MDPKINFHGVRGAVIFHYGLIDKPKEVVERTLSNLGFDRFYETLLSRSLPPLSKVTMNFCTYNRGARPSMAPGTVDCSSYTQWLYGSIGVEIPRLSIEQFYMGERVDISEIETGDLIFKSGKKDYFESERESGIGHVGMIIKENADEVSIYHAVPDNGIVKSPLERFYKGPDDSRFRGVRRIVPNLQEWVTLMVPDSLNEVVTTTQNVRWRVLTSLE